MPFLLGFAAGQATGPGAARQLVVVLSGEMEVETSDGEKRRFGRGDMLLADDTSGSGHITRALTEVINLFVPVANIPV